MEKDTQRGFMESLFDFTFESSITGTIVRIIYALLVLGAGLIALLFVIVGFRLSSGIGVLTLLIIAPLTFFSIVIWARLALEAMIVLHHIEGHMRRSERHLRQQNVSQPPSEKVRLP